MNPELLKFLNIAINKKMGDLIGLQEKYGCYTQQVLSSVQYNPNQKKKQLGQIKIHYDMVEEQLQRLILMQRQIRNRGEELKMTPELFLLLNRYS